jgi:deoxyribodipyrimidine photo-lyase
LRQQFPEAAQVDDHISETRGGRSAAEAQLAHLQAGKTYEKSRNDLNGAVSHLSPYIRHGVLSLAEVRDFALQQVHQPNDAEKFINELAVREYWQRVYSQIGDGIWDDQEAYKTGWGAADYTHALPDDILKGKTGLACIDAFITELYTTGYLHNHARMWLAGYVIHWRKIRWQTGAAWFLTHLLDGDPASNNLSWQWVASTFSSKPYYFNRENVERFSAGVYCKTCPLYGDCDFEGSYDEIAADLFPHMPTNPTNQRPKSSENFKKKR